MGYNCLEDLLDDISEIKKSIDHDGHTIYTSTGKNCDHLAKLISKQKTTINKPKYVKPTCKNTFPPKNQYRPKICYSKTEEKPRNNEHHTKKLPKVVDYRNTESKINYEEYEPEYVENMNKRQNSLWQREHRHSSNFRQSYDLKMPPLVEYRNNIRVQEKLDSRNKEITKVQKPNDNFRAKEIHSHHVYSAKHEYLNCDTKQPQDLAKLTPFSEKLLSARQREGKNIHSKPFSNFKEPMYREETYYRGYGRMSDSFINRYSKQPVIEKMQSRNIPEAYESVYINRNMFHNQISYKPQHLGNQRKDSDEDTDNEEYFQWMKDQTSRYTNRKIDIISGGLRVTIKND